MSQFLQPSERIQLVNVLSGLDDFAFPASRKTTLEVASLEKFVPQLGLDAVSRQFAGQLVVKLERYGPLEDQPGMHALGALLAPIVDTKSVSFEDRTFLARLIIKYGLTSDPSWIEEKRAAYGIEEQAPPVPGKAQLPAPSKLSAAPAPDFTIGAPDEKGLEAIINSEDNFLDLALLSGALACAPAVCQVEAPEGNARGTGFLVGPDLVLTNQHVIPNEGMLESVVMRFNYVKQANGPADYGRVVPVKLGFYHSSPEEKLDYALVRLAAPPLDSLVQKGQHRGYLMLSARAVVDRERVNIIQHPGSWPMKVVLTQNYVVNITSQRLQYVADTMEGSSGSPVFDQNWRVVAIHHSGKPYPPESAYDSAKKLVKGKWRVNEGIPLKPILEEISKHLPAS